MAGRSAAKVKVTTVRRREWSCAKWKRAAVAVADAAVTVAAADAAVMAAAAAAAAAAVVSGCKRETSMTRYYFSTSILRMSTQTSA